MSIWRWSSWDDEMIKYLQPMAKAKKPPFLELLFFANTFPLAFHYALALQDQSKGSSEISHLIKLRNWKEKSKDDNKNVIKYTNDPKSEKVNSLVTIFKPKWVFVPLTLGTSRLWHSLPSVQDAVKKGFRNEDMEPPQLSEFLKPAQRAGFDDVWIYAELFDLGVYLSKIVKEQNFKTTIFAGDAGVEGTNDSPLPFFKSVNIYTNILRLFIYGGSLSSYLREKYNRYLPLQLPDSKNGNDLMKTFVSCPSIYVKALQKYHAALYKAAKCEATKEENNDHLCPSFFTVYRGYNEMAWLLQHRSHFKDAKKFAKCLIDHNEDPI